jgi:hypothetical protein
MDASAIEDDSPAQKQENEHQTRPEAPHVGPVIHTSVILCLRLRSPFTFSSSSSLSYTISWLFFQQPRDECYQLGTCCGTPLRQAQDRPFDKPSARASRLSSMKSQARAQDTTSRRHLDRMSCLNDGGKVKLAPVAPNQKMCYNRHNR